MAYFIWLIISLFLIDQTFYLGFKISISDILLATKFRIETELNKFDEVEMSFLQETHASSRNLS